jgi:hypothetical protein
MAINIRAQKGTTNNQGKNPAILGDSATVLPMPKPIIIHPVKVEDRSCAVMVTSNDPQMPHGHENRTVSVRVYTERSGLSTRLYLDVYMEQKNQKERHRLR